MKTNINKSFLFRNFCWHNGGKTVAKSLLYNKMRACEEGRVVAVRATEVSTSFALGFYTSSYIKTCLICGCGALATLAVAFCGLSVVCYLIQKKYPRVWASVSYEAFFYSGCNQVLALYLPFLW